MTRLRYFLPILALLSAACTKLSAPVAGDYRATVEINGGEIPFQLRIATEGGDTQLWLLQDGESLPTTELHVKDQTLQATLPSGGGQLKANINADGLKGDLQLTDPQGNTHRFPFIARLNEHYRFIQQSSTDNIDVSGNWQLSAISPDHFSAPVTLRLKQSFDTVDGKLIIDQTNKTLYVYGQAHGDEVYFGSIGAGRAILFKGHINTQGLLEGELWMNGSSGTPAIATPIKESESENQDGLRQIALPWAVPTR